MSQRLLTSVVGGQAVAGSEDRPDVNPSDLSDIVAVASLGGTAAHAAARRRAAVQHAAQSSPQVNECVQNTKG